MLASLANLNSSLRSLMMTVLASLALIECSLRSLKWVTSHSALLNSSHNLIKKIGHFLLGRYPLKYVLKSNRRSQKFVMRS